MPTSTTDDLLYQPFAALRPAPEHAAAVAAPPYDVMNAEEARAMAAGKPWSFLHVSRPEIDLPAGTDPHDPSVYAKGADNLRSMVGAGVLAVDPTPAYYAYRMEAGGRSQTGVAAVASIAAYRSNRVRRHELTRPDKETDRVEHMVALNAQTGPVFVVHPDEAAVSRILDRAIGAAPPLLDATVAGARHQVWPIADPAGVAGLTDAFAAMDAVYIADGHHRSAAAARLAESRPDAGAHERFLVVSFPDSDVTILDYNRVVRDLGGRTPEEFLAVLAERFVVTPLEAARRPDAPGTFSLYLAGGWYRLELKDGVPAGAEALERLDVGLLTRHVLDPVLGIVDMRADPRIDFVGGARGLEGLAARVDSGEMAAGFALYPTSLADLMAVADAGEIMPPKSTWFEPKLADGLLCYPLGPIGG